MASLVVVSDRTVASQFDQARHDTRVERMSREPATVLDALHVLAADGFGASFSLADDGVHCGACGTAYPIGQIEATRVYRFEGPSDPDEEAAVYAMRCPVCDAGGALVSSYGPGAEPALADHLVVLEARLRER